MIYSIIGDLFYENKISDKSIMLCSTIEHILTNKDLYLCLKKWHNKYNELEYSENFKIYLKNKKEYPSYGIIAAIRTIPYIYMNKSFNEIIDLALKNNRKTHNHIESDNGTIALIKILYMAKEKKSKDDIKKELIKYYDITNIKNEMKEYKDIPTCKNIIPYSIYIFLESKNINECIEKCINLKYNINSNLIICLTLSSLYYKIKDDKFLINFYKYCPEDIFNLLNKFETKIINN